MGKFSGREISEETLKTILEVGMSGSSCVNARDWSFLVVRSRVFPPAPNYWQEILDT